MSDDRPPEAPPGVILDDLYRVVGDRDPALLRLVVQSVEPRPGIVRIRYALVGSDGTAIADAAGEPIVLVGGVDPDEPLPGIAPGAILPVPPRSAFGSELA